MLPLRPRLLPRPVVRQLSRRHVSSNLAPLVRGGRKPSTGSSLVPISNSTCWNRNLATAGAGNVRLVDSATTAAVIGDDTPAPYEPPTTGILSYLPAKVVPYAELIRLEKPYGGLYLFYPCVWSTLMAATMATPISPPIAAASTILLFGSGAFVMRSAGCTINDFWDRKFDKHVSRTRHRPIARGAVSPTQAFWFAGAQCMAGFGILLQFPVEAILAGIPSIFLVIAYPLAKRVTHYPQFVLGLAFSWGALLGFPAMGVSLVDGSMALAAAGCLYGANVFWTVLYDIIYAHQDLRDDVKAGVKGIVVRHPEITKPIMSALNVLQVGLLAGAGYFAGLGPIYYAWSVFGAGAANGWMIWRANLKDEKECWQWFKWNSWMVGGVMVGGGLTAEYLLDYYQKDPSNETAQIKENPVILAA
ncbi:Para-hydroxybenzoate--polyprenyltransferase, mitochondrial precursor (PHB:polyprenyltransferase) [Orbilia oligospora]|uniref:4-hydroxybenzoate polyprenyltransferase, mitochondrial n=1 Tax=Orbilia oligospora TaxID=2813651 RepID=A0A7C8JX88_ORBOL|nr:Para-hydroxybenzoate--polyprenyltransferase, mitochondrial precursor (PHB:polyprenyltransferase) [Orbilia oligospora]KAF3169960.1 Para-hydroxybenzoate--polyprenyltransferase, mitochondrial precursor (PHB:polyprenyltransferase) [Orbilia oligospora]KAF3248176.1 Para-hydroxybenzoate--polyprenyltransferase, mitochondrial precursor (PHB:polyprenyltransferase) [Orbilia oligospora]KAF3250448.1 Para-hydroxybenzoate--polyprenyltransferase, mitochondrial precursor (PHB:polyprenyltransferase) [Orbilia o